MIGLWRAMDGAMGMAAISIIRIYQRTLSFDHGLLRFLKPYGCCRFQPTCSEYAIKAIERRGFLLGSLKSLWRVLRCNPWNKGGYDPVK